MYALGEAIGLDKDTAQKTAEALMGEGLVEIKTLSGGIGITQSGIKEIEDFIGGKANDGNAPLALSGTVIVGTTDRQIVGAVLLNLKNAVNELKLDFNDIADFIIDIKTIELQLNSTAPKTAIIRECFNSIKTCLEKSRHPETLKQVNDLLGQ